VESGRWGLRAFQVIVALRYLRRNWLSYLAIVGVALSVMVLIVVMSVMVGFDEELRARIRGTLAHLIVDAYDTFGDYEALMRKIEALPDVEACAPRLEGPALIKVDKSYRWGQFNGIDMARECRATRFEDYWRDGQGEWGYDQTRMVLERIEGLLRDLGVGMPTVEVVRRLENLLTEHPVLKKLSDEHKQRLRQYMRAYTGLALDNAKMMRESDFRRLGKDDQALLLRQAAEAKVDLAEFWRRNERAKPNWGAPDLLQDEGEAPCIPGRDLIVVGRGVMGEEVALDVGDQAVIVVPVGFDERGVKRCRIAGKFKSGMYEYDSHQVYLPLDVVQRLMRKAGEVSCINVRLKDYGRARLVRAQILGILLPEELRAWFRALRAVSGKADISLEEGEPVPADSAAEAVAKELDALGANYDEWMATGNPLALQYHRRIVSNLRQMLRYAQNEAEAAGRGDLKAARDMAARLAEREAGSVGPGFRVWTWEDKRRNTLRAVWLERRILGLILFLLVLVSGFVILSILHTTVMAKTKDIGILKAIGARVRGIMSVFLLNGLCIGLIGSALGTLGGCLLSAYLNTVEDLLYRWFHFRVFPRDVYSLDKIPTASDPSGFIATISVLAVIVAFLAALYPAWRAARMDPVETLRYE